MDQKLELITIRADIQLNEKKLRDLENDLKILNKTRQIAFDEKNKQIATLQEIIDSLTKEGKRLQGLVHLYSKTLEDLQKDVNKYKELVVIQKGIATNEVASIHQEADNRIKAVKDREENVDMLITNVDKRGEVVTQKEILLSKKEGELQEREDKANKLDLDVRIQVKKAEATLASKQDLIQNMDRQLEEKRMQVQRLDTEIFQKQKVAETTGQEIESRLTAVVSREILVAGREKELHVTNTELIQKELWLADREATLRRAYLETIKRGGKIEGGQIN